jgi:hypothetical protein
LSFAFFCSVYRIPLPGFCGIRLIRQFSPIISNVNK